MTRLDKEMKIKKARTFGTANIINDRTKHIDVDSFLTDIFIWTDNPVAQKLIKLYESQLIISCLRPEEFTKGLHDFYLTTADYITKNNLQKEFLSFTYFVLSNIKMKQNKKILDTLYAYYDLIFQQFNYFVEHPNVVYGLDSNGNWLTTSEPYPNIDIAFEEASKNPKTFTFKKFKKALAKYGYKVNSLIDFEYLRANDQLLTNMFLTTANFMNEYTSEILPDELYPVATGFNSPKRAMPTDYYKSLLKEKRYFLPSAGIKGVYQRALDIKEIYFQEIFAENRIILLYQVTAKDGKGFYGFYDNKLELFFSPWADANRNAKLMHNYLENFILESYCYLTTDIDKRENEEGFKKRLVVEYDNVNYIDKTLPSVKFMYDTNTQESKNNKKHNLKTFEKRKYETETRYIRPMIRKLPPGAVASEEALQLAKEYNYVIKEGETFVRPFEKRVYVKNKEEK